MSDELFAEDDDPFESTTTISFRKWMFLFLRSLFKFIKGTSRSMEQSCIRNDGIVYNNVMNSAVVAVDSLTSKRTVYHFSKHQ